MLIASNTILGHYDAQPIFNTFYKIFKHFVYLSWRYEPSEVYYYPRPASLLLNEFKYCAISFCFTISENLLSFFSVVRGFFFPVGVFKSCGINLCVT